MTTALSSPSVCPGAGRPVIVFAGTLHGKPAARCPVCTQIVQVYAIAGLRQIGTHEGKAR